MHSVSRKRAFPRICASYSVDLLKEVHTTRRFAPQKLEMQAHTASLRLVMPVVDRCIFFAAKNSGNLKLGDCFISPSDTLRVLHVLYLCCELEPLLRAVLQQGTSIVYVAVPLLWLCMVLGVCGIDFQSSVRFGTECQKIVRNRFGTEFNKFRGTVRNRFGIKVRMRHLCNETC